MDCEKCGKLTPIEQNTAEGLCPECIDKKRIAELEAERDKLKRWIIKTLSENCPNYPDCGDDCDCEKCVNRKIQEILKEGD